MEMNGALSPPRSICFPVPNFSLHLVSLPVCLSVCLSGAPAAVCAAEACCHGDEGWYQHQEGRHDVSQDIHPKTRQRQVRAVGHMRTHTHTVLSLCVCVCARVHKCTASLHLALPTDVSLVKVALAVVRLPDVMYYACSRLHGIDCGSADAALPLVTATSGSAVERVKCCSGVGSGTDVWRPACQMWPK